MQVAKKLTVRHVRTCTTASLKVTLPDDVSSTIRRFSGALLVKAYTASGFGRALTNAMLSSIFFTCVQQVNIQLLCLLRGVRICRFSVELP
jgi:hypothetical protein